MKKFRNIAIVLLPALLFMFSCWGEDVPEKEVRIRVTGFQMENEGCFSMDRPVEFDHRMAGGLVHFTDGDENFYFVTEGTSVEDFTYVLPLGTYTLDIQVPEASLYGQRGASFALDPVEVSVNDTTDTLLVEVSANCALVLVEDPDARLEEVAYMIKRYAFSADYFRSYPMSMDSATGAWYAYFLPDTVPDDPSAFIWLYSGRPGEEKGGYSTVGMEKGHCYIFSVIQ